MAFDGWLMVLIAARLRRLHPAGLESSDDLSLAEKRLKQPPLRESLSELLGHESATPNIDQFSTSDRFLAPDFFVILL